MNTRAKIQYAIIWILRLLTVGAFVFSVAHGVKDGAVSGFFACVFIFLPEFIERRYKVKLLPEFSLLIVAFMYLSIVLGGVDHYYHRFWWWDVLLHLSSGVMLGVGGFLVVFVLYETNELRTSASWVAFLVVCFALALGAAWEIIEFALDESFGLLLQPSLFDTMQDLINDLIGALIVAKFGYSYIRAGKGWFFARMLDAFIAKNPHLKERPKFIRE